MNPLAGNLTVQLRDVSAVATAIATGDLGRKITVEAQGEILQIKQVINTMVDQLNAFASEVTRVAREVGTEGRLGGHAKVQGVAGTWKDLTDNVNGLARNLTNQVSNIAVQLRLVGGNGRAANREIEVETQGVLAHTGVGGFVGGLVFANGEPAVTGGQADFEKFAEIGKKFGLVVGDRIFNIGQQAQDIF